MNKIVMFILTMVFFTVGLNAQQTVGGPQSQYGLLESKLKKSDKSLTDEKKTTKAKFWTSRAEVMMDIWDLHRQHLVAGSTQKAQFLLIMGKPEKTEEMMKEDGPRQKDIYSRLTVTYNNGVLEGYEETNKIYEGDALMEAFNALQKAEELNTEGKDDKDIKENYDRLKELLDRQGINAFVNKDFDGALSSFETMLKINESGLYQGMVDTIVFYNAGMAASRADDTDKSIKYYELARKYNYKEPGLYVFLKQKYFETGDSATGISVLKEGFTKHPDSQTVIVELINFYLTTDQAPEALEFLQLAQKDDPTNVNYIFTEGTLYDKMGEFDKAVEAYERAIELDPTYFNGYFNLGVFYYNSAAKEYEVCNAIMDVDKYNACKIKADEILAKSVPFMEKAHEINPSDVGTLETLKTLYYRLKASNPAMEDKYNEVVEKLKNL